MHAFLSRDLGGIINNQNEEDEEEKLAEMSLNY